MQPELVAMGIGSLSVLQLPRKICNFVPAMLAGQAHRCHSTVVLLGQPDVWPYLTTVPEPLNEH
jgi:hypothetical protein